MSEQYSKPQVAFVMIIPVQRNILDFVGVANFVVNPTNLAGPMGAGLALQFANYLPDMARRYKQLCKDKLIHPGQVHRYPINKHSSVINLSTKHSWSDKTSDVSLIRHGLESLCRLVKDRPNATIVLPLLGAGNGGLSLKDSEKIIHDKLKDLPNPIVVADAKYPVKNIHAIVGGREITDIDVVSHTVIHDIQAICLDPTRPYKDFDQLHYIVSGGAKGVDTCAEKFAKLYKRPIIIIPAEWDLFGKASGYIRNLMIARLASSGSAIINNSSVGTLHTIRKFTEYEVPHRVTNVDIPVQKGFSYELACKSVK